MSSTRKQVRERVIEDSGLGVKLTGTSNGADTTHFQDQTPRAINADHVILDENAPLVITSLNTMTSTGIEFVDGGGSNDSLTDTGSGFGIFAIGDVITVSGSTSNDGSYTLLAAAAGTIQVATASLTAEAVGDTVTVISGPTWGEESRLTGTDITSGGVIQVAPALTYLPKTGQAAEVWHEKLLSVSHVNDVIDRMMEQVCSHWAYVPMTRLADGDFWNTDPDTAWTEVSATHVRTALAFPDHPMGRYLHQVTASAANGHSYQNVKATEKETWNLHVLVRCTTGDEAEIIVYDNSGLAEITLNGTASETDVSDWVWLRNSFVVPDDCEEFQVRLGAQNLGDVIQYAGAYLWRTGDREMPFQARVLDEEVVGDWFEWEGRSDLRSPSRGGLVPLQGINVGTSPAGLTAFFPAALGSGGPPIYQEKEYYPVFAGATFALKDADTTDCPLEYLAAAVCFGLHDKLYGMVERAAPLARPEGFVNPWRNPRKAWWNRLRGMDGRHGAVRNERAQHTRR